MINRAVISAASLFVFAACAESERPEVQVAAGDVQADANALDESMPQGGTRFVTAPTGNKARYRVREQLAGFDFPNDAVGETSDVTGAIVFDVAGKIVPQNSRIVIQANFKSDRDRRDNYIKGRTLQTEQFPTIVLQPREARGLPWPLPTTGTRSFTILGDLTVKGVTKPTSWRASAQFANNTVTGSTYTEFTFADITLEKPSVRSVLSVADTIKLEYDFRFVRDSAATLP